MPWAPELFSAPALERLRGRRRREELVAVPFFYGLLAGELDALVDSFAGEPEVHDPVRGRIRGVRAFESYVREMTAWFSREEVSVEDLGHVVLDGSGFEEVVLHFIGEAGPVELPVAVVADHAPNARLRELRIYYSSQPLTGRRTHRPPLLQSDPDLDVADVVGQYLRALSGGDLAAVVDAFEPDAFVRQPSSPRDEDHGRDAVRAFHAQLLTRTGGIRWDGCAVVDDGQTCALEGNLVGWGTVELAPQAALGVFARGETGRLAALRLYDDVDLSVTSFG
ncbi:hypothetical protein GCM10027053_00330 [Intrasporangium mesophilum]